MLRALYLIGEFEDLRGLGEKRDRIMVKIWMIGDFYCKFGFRTLQVH